MLEIDVEGPTALASSGEDRESPDQPVDTADRHLARMLQGVRGGFELPGIEEESAPADAPEPAPLRGRTIGRYLVLGTLGRGGMGTVLKAYDESLDRAIAIKLLHAEAAGLHALRLRREAQALAKLSHPNIVHVYEVGESHGQWFIAMELVPGQTLRQWRQEATRSWRECVRVYLQAGEGLAAAHALELVHRDFKPDNCIIDDKGRPRVLDFGLVGTAAAPSIDEASETDPGRSGSGSVDAPLTRTGTVMGTPAYMPLEQMEGREADARSDQFSFCVALYEAVYGERPFEGRSMTALMETMEQGAVRPAPRGSDVPQALRKVLLRGLSAEPAQRWPSMKALLDELRRIAAPRRWRGVVALGVGLLALGGGLGTTGTLEWLNRCTGAREQLEGAWDEARRQEVKTAILGTGLSYAPGTWERVEPRLDAYAYAWATEHTDACEATRSRDEQSEEEMSLRMGCLRQRRQHLRATVNELGHADATVVENAVQAVASLPGLERCRDLEALRAEVPPPEDPVVAEQVAALDERLVEARAKQQARKYEDGLRLADEVVDKGAELGYEPLMARAWLQQGVLRERRGDYEGAVQAMREAYGTAVAHTMKDEAAQASAQLIHVLGDKLARHQEARDWAEHAEALSRAAGTDEARASYLNYLGIVTQGQGDYEEARELHGRALAIREKALGPDHPEVGASLNNLGNAALLQGKYEEARELYGRALAIWEKTLGPDHPDLARLLGNLGTVAFHRGELERARELYERALAIFEKALGPDHPEVATSLNNLGMVSHALLEYEQAREYEMRALAVMEKALGPNHPNLAAVLTHLGLVAQSQRDHEQARELYGRAQAIWEKALGPDHPDLAGSLTNLGSVAYNEGKYEEARDFHERALAILEKAFGPDHPKVADPLIRLGNVAYEEGKYEEARDFYQRARAISEKAFGPDHPKVALLLSNLGNVAESQGKYEEARDFYQRVIAIEEKALDPDHPDVAYSLVGLGNTMLGLGKPADALPLLERALSIRTTHEVYPHMLAEARFALARALWTAPATEGRDRPRAYSLSEQARDAFAMFGDTQKERLAEVQAWLAKHRLP